MDTRADQRRGVNAEVYEREQLIDAYIKLMGIGYTLKVIKVGPDRDGVGWEIKFTNMPYTATLLNYQSESAAHDQAQSFMHFWVSHHVLNKTTTGE